MRTCDQIVRLHGKGYARQEIGRIAGYNRAKSGKVQVEEIQQKLHQYKISLFCKRLVAKCLRSTYFWMSIYRRVLTVSIVRAEEKIG